MRQKKFYILASNQKDSGPRTVATQALSQAKKILKKDIELIHLCSSSTKKINNEIKRIKIVSKSSLLNRVFFELFCIDKLINIKKRDILFSLQDFPIRTSCKNLYIYAHNALPFHKLRWTDYIFDPWLSFYKNLYAISYYLLAHSSANKVVQTKEMKKNLLKIKKNQKIFVVNPLISKKKNMVSNRSKHILFFPTRPRPFKQIELACKAVILFNEKFSETLKLIVTISKNENLYSKYLYLNYGRNPFISFIGQQSQSGCENIYSTSKGLIFTSRVETWGLPISEAMEWKLPVIIPDLPYAREVAGNYPQSHFCDPNNIKSWVNSISKVILSPCNLKKSSMPSKNKQMDWEVFFKRLNE